MALSDRSLQSLCVLLAGFPSTSACQTTLPTSSAVLLIVITTTPYSPPLTRAWPIPLVAHSCTPLSSCLPWRSVIRPHWPHNNFFAPGPLFFHFLLLQHPLTSVTNWCSCNTAFLIISLHCHSVDLPLKSSSLYHNEKHLFPHSTRSCLFLYSCHPPLKARRIVFLWVSYHIH